MRAWEISSYPRDLKKDVGIEVIEATFKQITDLLPKESSQEVKNEILEDHKTFKIDNLDQKVHTNTTRIGLAIREWIKKNNLTAFTYNFPVIDKDSGLPTIPFPDFRT